MAEVNKHYYAKNRPGEKVFVCLGPDTLSKALLRLRRKIKELENGPSETSIDFSNRVRRVFFSIDAERPPEDNNN